MFFLPVVAARSTPISPSNEPDAPTLKWPHRRTEQVSRHARRNEQEKISRRAVHFLDHRPDIHQHPHVETDVQQSAMQKNCGDESPGLADVVGAAEAIRPNDN